jgi:hypothetical protein
VLVIQSQTMKIITAASDPYVLLYEEKCATYSANRAETRIHRATANIPPGVTHRKPGWRTFGAA